MLDTLGFKRIALVAIFVTLWVVVGQLGHAQERQSSTQRSVSKVTPIYALLAYRPRETAHLADLDSELIVAQIASFSEETQAHLFIEFHSSIQLQGARLSDGDSIRYIVYLGLYEDDDTARWAHESFAEENPNYLTSNFKRLKLGDLKPHILR
ncbi:MAG: hypothetical protein OXG25_14890 [Gammaproteobacteria bacterium]|nr:hypothetical protein [Gammaproteobacteria bacterium]